MEPEERLNHIRNKVRYYNSYVLNHLDAEWLLEYIDAQNKIMEDSYKSGQLSVYRWLLEAPNNAFSSLFRMRLAKELDIIEKEMG